MTKARTQDDEFTQFWAQYPRKIGKIAARKAFDHARRQADQQVIMDGLARYLQYKPAYADWCHPKTWLSQGRWMDEYDASTNGTGATEPAETWWDECKRLHQLRCGGPGPHRSQMLIDRQRTLDALKEML